MAYPDVERRRRLAAAALGREPGRPGPDPESGEPLRAVAGELIDVSPHLLIVLTPDGGEERLVIAPWATAWREREVAPADLPPGTRVIVRTRSEGRVAERIWGDVTRMTGTLLSVEGRRDLTVELDEGAHRGRRGVVIPYRSSGRLRVRHPQLEPGFLFDAIGVRRDGTSHALLPATSQPTYPARAVPAPPPAYGGVQPKISGAGAWSDGFEGGRGAAYPMLERSDTGCADAEVSCAGLPYLAIGSLLQVRNLCTDRSARVPIVACGCVAGRFCDRCVECDTSPRGRVVELSPSSFVELGGELTKGCFNAQVGMG
jgi:hypothetical protein